MPISQQDAVFLERLASAYKMLGEPNRLRIVNVLIEGPLCVKSIYEILNIPQPTISKHLNLMHIHGFLERRREGKFVLYRLNEERAIDIKACVLRARQKCRVLSEEAKKAKERVGQECQ